MVVTDLAQALQVALRGRDVPSLAENGLDKDRGGVARSSLLLQEELELRV